jgi:APA family basic amino acid/polyamine antiporter
MPTPAISIAPSHAALSRDVGLGGAVFIGLGSILGTGVFVSIAVAAGPAGPWLPLAIVLAGLLALGNGLSSAQLAAAHPVSGGTYEYGYRYLNAPAGFLAGWMFLCAKTASAATAALGCAGYLSLVLGLAEWALVPLGLAIGAALTVLTLGGLRRTNAVNVAVVSVTLLALAWFVVSALLHPSGDAGGSQAAAMDAHHPGQLPGVLEACALLFVAFTGYGRIATMGEEVKNPGRTIPIAVVLTLLVALGVYVLVAIAGTGASGPGGMSDHVGKQGAAPLSAILSRAGDHLGATLLSIGAITAMLGVLLNLILGLSRVWLAMGRRADMPRGLARLRGGVGGTGGAPVAAIVLTGVTVCGLVLLRDVRTTWAFSAFTVLVYYALTNLAALRLPAKSRRFPRWIAVGGLVTCLGLAFFVDTAVWLTGLAVAAAGMVWHGVARRMSGSKGAP